MSSSSLPHLLFCFLIFFSSTNTVFSLPVPLLTPIEKDHPSLQHTTTIHHGTPFTPTKLLIDLSSSFSWIHYNTTNFTSNSHNPIPCDSPLCKSLGSLACSNQTCSLFPENPLTRRATIAASVQDLVALPSTDGRNPGPHTSVSDFIFASSSQPQLLHGLPADVSGVFALGRSDLSFPAQVSRAFSLPYIFTLCLSSSPSAPGVGFFGTRGPFIFHPEIDLSNSLVYTPLILNPVSHTVMTYHKIPSPEYYIGVSSVRVNGKPVLINEKLLTIDENGYGGTKINSVVPYTTMESSIYRAFTKMFIQEAALMNLTMTKPVRPYGVCFKSDVLGHTRVGPAVPTVDFVMHHDRVYWRFFGGNLMVRIPGDDASDDGDGGKWCLGFVDGGINATTSVVIGAHQIENNLIQFDLRLRRFGFSSSLMTRETTCANFNFTINPKLNW
ncbi:hypothetical protein C5167_014233 [Papaver somniferum]|uniref:Peptidase A1 domain-containing protein n=1 Tax=Papaver somniferum TaxID=3469 RepID=A0A4Y7J3I6_PAPSO|nr:basic 7S globulin 2-like [Papaver somniferum]RZC55377.1 hypothetical protein C5167_014233 [Papaver somniferum]